MSEESKLVAMLIIGIILLSFVGIVATYSYNYRTYVMLPRQMAEKGMCWQPVTVRDTIYFAYTPCHYAPCSKQGESKVKE